MWSAVAQDVERIVHYSQGQYLDQITGSEVELTVANSLNLTKFSVLTAQTPCSNIVIGISWIYWIRLNIELLTSNVDILLEENS